MKNTHHKRFERVIHPPNQSSIDESTCTSANHDLAMSKLHTRGWMIPWRIEDVRASSPGKAAVLNAGNSAGNSHDFGKPLQVFDLWRGIERTVTVEINCPLS